MARYPEPVVETVLSGDGLNDAFLDDVMLSLFGPGLALRRIN
jgi:hypothetical protein